MSLHHISIRYIAEEMDGPAGDLLWRAVPVYQAQIGINDTPITRALEDGNFKLAEKLILDNTDRSYLDEGPFVKIPLALVLSGDPEFRKHPRHLGIAKLLVECGADPNLRIPTSELQRASPSGMEYLINLISSTRDLVLLEGIPNPVTPSQNLTKPRRTPEGAVIADITNPLRTIGLDGEEHLSPSDLREQLLSLLEIFLANGGDPNVTTTKSNSTLYHIVLSDYDPDIEVVMKLCEAGGDLNIPNGHGTTPLMDVISYADGDAALDVLHRIWERNPDISSLEAQNFANETALWRAMLAGSPKLAVELLQKGADPGNRARVYVARWHRIPYWDRVDRLFGVEASSNGVSALYAPLLQQSSPYKYHTAVYTYSKGLESIERPQPFNLSLMNKIIACAVYPVVDNTPTAKVFTPKVETELEQLLFSETKFDVNKILPRGMTRQDIGVLLLGNLKAGLQQLCVRKIMHQILFTKPVDVAFDMIDELKTDAKVVEPEKLKCPYHPEDNWDASHDDSSINSDLSSNDNEQDPNNIKDHWNLIHQLCPPIMRELVTSRLELPPVLVPHFEIEAARLQLGASIYTYEHVDCMLDWEGMSYVGSTDPFLENSVDEDVYEEYGGDDDDDDDDDNFDDGDDNDDDDEYYVQMQLSLQRIFVGNLPTDVTENEITKRFSKYGKVQSTEIKHRPDSSTFAYLNLEASAQNIDECFKVLPKKKWGGNHVTVQIAKESFLSRLSKERQQASSAHEQSVVNNGTSFVKTEDDGNTEDTSMGNVTSKNKRVRIHDSSPKFDAKEDPSTSFTIVESFRDETKNNKLIFDMNGEVLEQSCAVVERLSSGASIADGRTVDKNSGDFKKKKKRISDCISTCNPDVENETSDIKLISEVSSDDEVEYNKKLPMFRGTMNISMTDEEQSKEVRTKLHKRKKNIITADRLQDARYSDGDHFYEKDRINEKKKLQKGINGVHNLNVEHRKESSLKTTLSEEKRKKSIEDKRKSFKNQIQAVKRSLAAVDVPLNKKIVFNDEEEQDGLDENKDYNQDKSSELQSSEYDNQKTTLFESESSDYEPDDFKIKSQFEGRKGQKLLELQTKYVNDKRFRLDERFYDSDDEKSKNNVTTLENEDEKQHHLKILKDVLGQDVLLTDEKKEKERKKSLLRFDPSKMDYKKFSLPTPEPKQVCEHDSKEVNKFGKTVKNAESKDVETLENNAPKIEVSKEKYYKVTDALKETLLDKSKRSGGFSLLEMFGPGDDSSKGEMPDYQSTTVSKKKQIGWTKNPFKYDSSESESEETEPKKSLYQEPEVSETVVSSRRVETFFFTKDDPRLKEGITFFTTKQYVDENEFAKRRRELKLIIKSKVKNNLKKKQPWKRKLGGQKKKFTRRK